MIAARPIQRFEVVGKLAGERIVTGAAIETAASTRKVLVAGAVVADAASFSAPGRIPEAGPSACSGMKGGPVPTRPPPPGGPPGAWGGPAALGDPRGSRQRSHPRCTPGDRPGTLDTLQAWLARLGRARVGGRVPLDP